MVQWKTHYLLLSGVSLSVSCRGCELSHFFKKKKVCLWIQGFCFIVQSFVSWNPQLSMNTEDGTFYDFLIKANYRTQNGCGTLNPLLRGTCDVQLSFCSQSEVHLLCHCWLVSTLRKALQSKLDNRLVNLKKKIYYFKQDFFLFSGPWTGPGTVSWGPRLQIFHLQLSHSPPLSNMSGQIQTPWQFLSFQAVKGPGDPEFLPTGPCFLIGGAFQYLKKTKTHHTLIHFDTT